MAKRGKDTAVYVNTGTEVEPEWVRVGGQRGGTFNRGSDTLDVASKDSDGWADEDYASNNWGHDFDGLIPENKETYAMLEDAWYNQEFVMTRWTSGSNRIWEGKCIITDFPEEAPYDDAMTYSITLSGKGKPIIVDEEGA